MNDPDSVTQLIRAVLNTETDAINLSNKLFSPEGLFNQLAKTEEERRAVAGSALFGEAQKRLLALQRQDAAEFSRKVEQVQKHWAGEARLVKIEQQ